MSTPYLAENPDITYIYMMYIVYKTTNTINGHFYIGVHKQCTLDFDGYLGSGRGLTRAIKKYGKDIFVRETLFVFDDAEIAYLKECEIVNPIYKNQDCYNMRPGGRGLRLKLENIHTETWRKKVSAAHTGKKHTTDTKKKISISKIGDKNPSKLPGVGEKISMAKKGIPNQKLRGIVRSDETRRRCSIAQKKRFKTTPHSRLGKKLSDESKKKISEAAKKRFELKKLNMMLTDST